MSRDSKAGLNGMLILPLNTRIWRCGGQFLNRIYGLGGSRVDLGGSRAS